MLKVKVIAIDGPSGAGKSTVSKILAKRLGFRYISTGDMYRAVGLLARERGIPFNDVPSLCRLIEDMEFSFQGERVFVNGLDVTDDVRSEHVGKLASDVSKVPEVRKMLVSLQRSICMEGSVVMEGRDIGTNVFPETPYKFFLTASLDERARRRAKELEEMGQPVDVVSLKEKMRLRDVQDSTRKVNPLRPAHDAYVIDTTCMTPDEVVKKILEVVLGEGYKG